MKIKDILKGAIYGSDYVFPLWKELLGGLVIFLGLSSFCSASSITYTGTVDVSNFGTYKYILILPVPNSIPALSSMPTYISNISCRLTNVSNDFAFKLNVFSVGNTYGGDTSTKLTYNVSSPSYEFSYSDNRRAYSFGFYSSNINGITASFDYECVVGTESPNSANMPVCSPQYTSEECQSEYDLVSSSDLSTCQSDLSSCQSSNSGYDTLLNNCSTNLNSCTSSLSSCLQLNCPISTGGVSWSSLFINNIQHLGAPTINISIPSEIQWDYLNENDEFNLTIDGYNTDADYIEGIINLQNSKPSKEDLNDIITKVIPLFVPGFVIVLFLYVVFRFIKKIF